MGCNKQKLTPKETVTKFYNAYNTSNYSEIKKLISDSIIITQGSYIMPYDQDSYYELFKWDSVFKPTYKTIELKEEKDHVNITLSSTSLRYAFLKNNPLTTHYKILFNNDKISKIEVLESKGANWDVWQKERDSLVS